MKKLFVLLVLCTVIFLSEFSEAEIVCDKFEIESTLNNDELKVSVKTDLPDTTIVMVSVDRIYYRENDSEAYSDSYFSQKSSIAEWREPRFIKIDNNKDVFISDGDFYIRNPSDDIAQFFIGQNGSHRGVMGIYGDNTGGQTGGLIQLYTADDYDTNIDFYRI